MEIKIDQDSEAKEVADLQKPSEESSKCKSQYKKGWSLDDLHRSKEHPQLLRSLMRRLSEEEISLVYQAYRDMYPTTAKLQVIWHDFKQGKFQRDYMREIQDVIYPLADDLAESIDLAISIAPAMVQVEYPQRKDIIDELEDIIQFYSWEITKEPIPSIPHWETSYASHEECLQKLIEYEKQIISRK